MTFDGVTDAGFDGSLLELLARVHEPHDDQGQKDYLALWDSLCGKGRLKDSAQRLIALGFVAEYWESHTPKTISYNITPEGYAHVRGIGAELGRIEFKLDSGDDSVSAVN